MPFAFVTTSSEAGIPNEQLLAEMQKLVRTQVGAIATLGGMLQGRGMIPKTRSGKTLRRVLRELLEHAVNGEFEKAVNVPSTVEDAGVVEVARGVIKGYFEGGGGRERHAVVESKL